jgi:hypothetical protein
MPEKTVYMPDWLAALRCPIRDDVRLSHAWKVPGRIPDVIEGFGPRHPPARRWIVIKLDTMAYDLSYARAHEPAFSVKEATAHFASTANAAKNLLNKVRPPQVRRAILTAARRKQIRQDGPKWLLAMDLHASLDFDFRRDLSGLDLGYGADPDDGMDPDAGTPLDAIDLILELIREGAEEALRDLDSYYGPLGRRVANIRKMLVRTLLWDPLFDLMHDFGIKDFDEHQPLIQTVRSLHLALGMESPDANRLKQVAFLWRKRVKSLGLISPSLT